MFVVVAIVAGNAPGKGLLLYGVSVALTVSRCNELEW